MRTAILTGALGVEFIILGTTKYWNPIAKSTDWFGPFDILVPLGISFYTFQTVGYLFDIYRNRLPPEKHFFRYALFLSFFPHLLAGPIEPAQSFLPQLQRYVQFEKKVFVLGCLLIIFGLFKKLVIADHLSPIVSLIFDQPDGHKGLAVALGLFFARYQIYCDFSGYTDIALGSAQVLGFQLSPNFKRPFFANSITEYWRRWHMSLGIWIRQYIFYPLVSTSFSRFGVHGLILLTFLVLAIWHGGTLNFLIYGIWHGSFVIIDLKTKELRQRFYHFSGASKHPKILHFLAVLATFFLIVVPPTLFFRATSFDQSIILLQNLIIGNWEFSDLKFINESLMLTYHLKVALCALAGLELMQWLYEVKKINLTNWSFRRLYACLVLLALIIVLYGHFVNNTKFIYMQF
ncbi:MAG: MBOAT family O-acyltransferase [Bdellovibrionota bacterium]